MKRFKQNTDHITSEIPISALNQARNKLGYKAMDECSNMFDHKLDNKHIEYIDQCAHKWNITFDRAYLRCVNEGLNLLIQMRDLAQTYESIGDEDVPD